MRKKIVYGLVAFALIVPLGFLIFFLVSNKPSGNENKSVSQENSKNTNGSTEKSKVTPTKNEVSPTGQENKDTAPSFSSTEAANKLVSGTVKAISSSVITVMSEGGEGDISVKLTSSTIYQKASDLSKISFSDIKVGLKVQILVKDGNAVNVTLE